MFGCCCQKPMNERERESIVCSREGIQESSVAKFQCLRGGGTRPYFPQRATNRLGPFFFSARVILRDTTSSISRVIRLFSARVRPSVHHLVSQCHCCSLLDSPVDQQIAAIRHLHSSTSFFRTCKPILPPFSSSSIFFVGNVFKLGLIIIISSSSSIA